MTGPRSVTPATSHCLASPASSATLWPLFDLRHCSLQFPAVRRARIGIRKIPFRQVANRPPRLCGLSSLPGLEVPCFLHGFHKPNLATGQQVSKALRHICGVTCHQIGRQDCPPGERQRPAGSARNGDAGSPRRSRCEHPRTHRTPFRVRCPPKIPAKPDGERGNVRFQRPVMGVQKRP